MEFLKRIWNHRPSPDSMKTVKARSLRSLFVFFTVMLCCTVVSRASDSMTVARVQAQKPSRGAITHTVEADGRLEAANQLAVTAPEALVKSVAVAEGDRVKTGDLLFTFDTAELEKQLAQKRLELQKLQLGLQEQQEKDALAETEGETKRERAEEDLKLAQEKADLNVRQTAEEMRRARKELRDYNGSVEDDADYDEDEYDEDEDPTYIALRDSYREKKRQYDQARHDKEELLLTAQRALEDAEKAEPDTQARQLALDCQLKQLEISDIQESLAANGEVLSPADGIVSGLSAAVGKRATGEAAVYLTGTGGLRFCGEISADEKKYLSKGDPVILSLPDLRQPLDGLKVSAVKPLSGENNGRFSFTVDLPDGQGALDMAGSAKVRQKSQNYDLLVPLSALYADGPQTYLLLVRERETALGLEQTAERVDVTVLEQNESQAAVSGAVSSDDLVVTDTDKPLSSGDRVRPQGTA